MGAYTYKSHRHLAFPNTQMIPDEVHVGDTELQSPIITCSLNVLSKNEIYNDRKQKNWPDNLGLKISSAAILDSSTYTRTREH